MTIQRFTSKESSVQTALHDFGFQDMYRLPYNRYLAPSDCFLFRYLF